MEPRFNYMKVAPPAAFEAVMGLSRYLSQSSIEQKILNMVELRASQINGCAYCIDMHWKDLRALGETEQRLYGLDAWRESPYYSERERAALAWTEAVTNIRDGASDGVYEEVKKQFSEREMADLTLCIATINLWNRLNIAARTVPGTYKPGQHQPAAKATATAKSA